MNSKIWEQSEVPHNVPVYNIEFETNSDNIVLQIRGDAHIGLNCIDVNEYIDQLIESQNSENQNMFVIETGDLIENGLKSSIGHNYDIGIPDPTEQIKLALDAQEILDSNLYKNYDKMNSVTRRKTKHAKRIGFIGNHEYRTRKEAGVWLNNQLYSGKGVIDGGVHGLIKLKIVNKKLKMSKTYRIYAAHRLTNSSAGITHETMLKNFRKKKSEINADIYVCGHYHRRFVAADYRYNDIGKKEKILYLSNPSPADTTEYGMWGLYSPTGPGYYVNAYLPLDPKQSAWATV